MEIFRDKKALLMMLGVSALAIVVVGGIILGGNATFRGATYDPTIANDEHCRISVQNESPGPYSGFTIVFHNMQEEGTLGLRVKDEKMLIGDKEYRGVVIGEPLEPGGADYRAIIVDTAETVDVEKAEPIIFDLEAYDPDTNEVVVTYEFRKVLEESN